MINNAVEVCRIQNAVEKPQFSGAFKLVKMVAYSARVYTSNKLVDAQGLFEI